MKKILLTLSVLAMAGTTAFGQTGTTIEGVKLESHHVFTDYPNINLSPDGKWAVGADEMGTMVIFNLTDGSAVLFQADEEAGYEFSLGKGNAFASDGTIVGSTTLNGTAAYCKDGVWHLLPVPDAEKVNLANGISADGSVIVGSIGNADISLTEDNIMNVPAVWTRKADGTYGDPEILPYPTEDFTGHKPQYILALCVNPEGNRIISLMHDWTGFVVEPVIFDKGADGKWTCNNMANELINPNNLPVPVYPGESPVAPNVEDYMSEDQLAAYNAAMEEWRNNGCNPDLYPNAADYMTAEQTAAYNAAVEAYNAAAAEYNQKLEEYQTAMDAILNSGTTFEMNNIAMSSDGSKFALTSIKQIENPDPMGWMPFVDINVPYLFTFGEDGKATYAAKATTENVALVSLADDGRILGTHTTDAGYEEAWISDTEGNWQTLADYVKSVDTESYNWMKENMVHSVPVDFNYETGEEIYGDVFLTGLTYGNSDFTVFLGRVGNNWDWEAGVEYYDYLYKIDPNSAIKNVVSADFGLTARRGGIIEINGVADAQVYDLQGREVFAVKGASGEVATGLASGVYIIKGTDAEGRVITRKAVL